MENYTELIKTLRSKKSRDNKELLDAAASAIEELVREVPKTAHWVIKTTTEKFGRYEASCSNCGAGFMDDNVAETIEYINYCEKCGARMKIV